jgi:hypothetical protein
MCEWYNLRSTKDEHLESGVQEGQLENSDSYNSNTTGFSLSPVTRDLRLVTYGLLERGDAGQRLALE